MNKTLLAILTIFLLSCGADKTAADKTKKVESKATTESHQFRSVANGTADIRLDLNSDQTFSFHMRTIPQPMEDEEETIINSTGTWTEEKYWAKLTFINDAPILNAVFDLQYADENQFKLIDDNSVAINVRTDVLKIWGVTCERVKE
jgi:hypothetical protein